jgi:hypothetical protein
MSEPSFYPSRPRQVRVRETHVSIVFLAGDRAYKLKKPVRMPFLDYSTLERRRHFCDEEVRLNRRFSHDVYLGTAGIAACGDGFALTAPDDPVALEYAVVMRRFADESTLESMVERGAAGEGTADTVATAIAEAHAAAPVAPPDSWTPAYIEARLDENFDTMRPDVGVLVDRFTYDAVRRFSYAFLGAHRSLLGERIREGMVRDVHGDLRADHVLIEDGRVSFVDCVEFDAGLRRSDVAADLAFLTMDLERLGARRLADAVTRGYATRTGESGLGRLLPFYGCYRAWVRAKATALRLRDVPAADPGRRTLEERAQGLVVLALRLAWRARLPLVVVLCGVAGSGKSTLAAELARYSGLSHLSSDRVRKELAGIPPERRGGQELYGPEVTARTYRQLAARARAAVAGAGGAVVDATFHRAAQRAELRDLGARVLWAECRAPEQVIRERTAARERGPERASDATWPVARAQLAAWEPLDDVPPPDRLSVRTDRPVTASLAEMEAFVSSAVDAG